MQFYMQGKVINMLIEIAHLKRILIIASHSVLLIFRENVYHLMKFKKKIFKKLKIEMPEFLEREEY